MASRGLETSLILVLVAVLFGGAAAQSGCTTTLISLAPCLNYITGNSSSPSSSCCSQLASVVQSSPQCLCSVLNGGASSFGITINQTLALALPGACNVQTPPVSRCNGTATPTAPATSPAASPADETPVGAATPSASKTPSDAGSTGSKTVPSTTAESSDGSIARAPVHLVLSLVFIAVCASTFTKF
ncbi:hypothetical protein SLEP1_g1070 [Rubroshorea leprosula]|uniref:Bifunctional inhibitor/plant lipid transfer protein/seed storage helical domain-containing protein n=1 Tax=Rubroshorea leprosula TaxID=152421 RepID=A0AAV5HCL6_9ROSI|nr:hypothetical protein SLEP1_g1070 [Rubroshorea leprosula]